MHFYNWLTVVMVGFFVMIIPGPNMAIVVRNSLFHNRYAGVYTAIGLALGNLVHTSYCLVGIGVLISRSILLFNIIRLLGAGYLVFLGIKSLRSKPLPVIAQTDAALESSTISALRSGFLTDLLNPKATLFFLALFTQIVDPGTPMFAQVIYAMTVVMLEFAFLAFLAMAIGHQSVRKRLQAVNRHIEQITGIILITLGLKIMTTK